MFELVLNMALSLLNASVHSAAHINQTEWTLIESLQAALTTLLAKKPATMQ